MKKCENCGREYPGDLNFCTDCGSVLHEVNEDVTVPPEGYEPVGNPPKKKMSKKGKLIILGGAVALVVIAIMAFVLLLPRDLYINDGKNIELNVGDSVEVEVTGEGLNASDYQNIVWTSDNDDVVKVDDGKIEAFYDKDSFNLIADDSLEGDNASCSYTANVEARLDKGVKTWEGTARIIVSLEPVEFESGKIIKEPADAKDSYITITPGEDNNVYFYLKSKTKEANDMSFVIKKGEETTVYVPCDTYEFYKARGEIWYGSEALFGPQTVYTKDDGEYEFTSGTYWTLVLESPDGNIEAEDIGYDEFPEL